MDRNEMYRLIIYVLTAMMIAGGQTGGQTPVEALIARYADVQGARYYSAQGIRMSMVRPMLKSTPIGPVASDVTQLDILKMQGTQPHERAQFQSALMQCLKTYDYYGKYDSKNGVVDIYVLRTGPQTVEELVIYNPAIWSLNAFRGDFTVDALISLDKSR